MMHGQNHIKFACREVGLKSSNGVLLLICIMYFCTDYTTNTVHTACIIYNVTLL